MTPALPEAEAIEAAARDYAAGWYTANAERVARCLHLELAKRTIERDPHTNAEHFVHLTRDHLIQATARGGGHNPAAVCTVSILDVYREIATVRVDSPEYVDYLHLAKAEGRWQIINVLWADKP